VPAFPAHHAYPGAAAANEEAGLPKEIGSTCLPNSLERLVGELRRALDSNSFLVNGGRLGFPCQVGPGGRDG